MQVKRTRPQKVILSLVVMLVTLSAVFSVGVAPVHAQTPLPPPVLQCQGSNDPTCGTDPAFKPCTQKKKSQAYKDCLANSTNLVKRYVNPAIAILSLIVGLAVVIGIIIGGMQYISSAGDAQRAASGKKHIWHAIMALLIYLFLFAILNFLIPGGIV